jgi:hypothetical protein
MWTKLSKAIFPNIWSSEVVILLFCCSFTFCFVVVVKVEVEIAVVKEEGAVLQGALQFFTPSEEKSIVVWVPHSVPFYTNSLAPIS